jgi:hypothetical protein
MQLILLAVLGLQYGTLVFFYLLMQRTRGRQTPKLPKVWTIPTTLYKPPSDILDPCVICLEDLLPGAEVGVLKCSHTFHISCLEDWLNKAGRLSWKEERRADCPVCRVVVEEEGVV